jgi:fatty-acyl-CoA synthase
MAPNIPVLYEAHFGVAMTGAVLNAINIRLDANTIAFQLQHAGAKVFIADREFSNVVQDALAALDSKPLVIEIDDAAASGEHFADLDYESLLADADPEFEWSMPQDEWQAISLNYTSGTTGNPKGVVYHHRGAYLNAVSNAMSWDMPLHPVYLWTLPMFHCNGWCFPWTVTAMAGTHVCLRKVEAHPVFDAIARYGVTHFCGAPIVLNMLLVESGKQTQRPGRVVQVATGGAPPPETVIARMEELGMRVTHLYGLTETYGPSVACAWHQKWDEKPLPERARLMARQGVNMFMVHDYMVADTHTMEPVPKDGQTIGEIMLRGNTTMKGYLKNPAATEEAFAGGWLHTGDLAVWHEDGYMQVKDRAKDIIISGGENISTVEVEDVLYKHPAVLEAAVVARPDAHWGETPCAFVTLRSGAEDTEVEDIVEHCRANLAHYKVPKTMVFGPLPKTATGKIQKFVLRDRARQL